MIYKLVMQKSALKKRGAAKQRVVLLNVQGWRLAALTLAALRQSSWLLVSCAVLAVNPVMADSIVFSGTITQSTQDGTGPAVNNPSLNQIADGDRYSVALSFQGTPSSPGTYALSVTSFAFSDPAAHANETAFGVFQCGGQSTLACFTISPDGSYYDISLLGCLTTGSGCLVGNELDANFKILAANLNSQNVAAQAEPFLTPMDLLEDDGVTDIQGTVANYSYTGAASAPEPASIILLFAAFAWGLARWLSRTTNRNKG